MTIQAILFKKKYWTAKRARKFLKENGFEPIKRVHETKNYYRYRLVEPDDESNYITRKSSTYPSILYIIKI